MTSLFLSLTLLMPAQGSNADPKENDVGIRPLGANGKPLNLDFETGTLQDWTAEGDAFKDQPIKGDTVSVRRGDSHSRHQGQYWIGGYEKYEDKPQGTLTSAPFKVAYPWASFLVGGGPHTNETCVELIALPSKEVFFRASGLEEEDMRRVVVDLSKYRDKEIQIRLVDRHSGGWGHINFDDFRFHERKPSFPNRPRSEPPAAADSYKFAGLAPQDAAKAMTVPEGFEVSLFAGEPDLHQPIAFCIDHRGRLWVVEAFTYPQRNPFPGPVLPEGEKAKGDRILIFEDTHGSGKFDKKMVFMEGLNLVSGIEVGFGGVWIGAAPYFLFIPHDEKSDKPSGPPKILLDGWGYQDTHETLNSFIWGPDGWLYGCHGVFTHSRVGKPGTPDGERVPINAGIWRYHPTKHEFEVFAHGTSNPWGLDYNASGDFFIEACVIPHMWHIIQNGRYARQAGAHFNPFTYDDIKTIALHRHFVGATPHGGNGRSDSAGGGHAHSGLMCYQGGLWPPEYAGKLFMGNLHGHRFNVDAVTPKGSGYSADRNPDFLLTNDRWSIPVAIKYGPDGNAFFIDWYDKQICHTADPGIWDRTNGRIYKISYTKGKPLPSVDLAKASLNELLKCQTHPNEWYSRMARRLLQERFASGTDSKQLRNAAEMDACRETLTSMATERESEAVRLRAIWTEISLGIFSPGEVERLLKDASPNVRAWAVRAASTIHGFPFASTCTELAKSDPSQVVRREIASQLHLLPKRFQWDVLFSLTAHPEDANDHNLPYLYWYAAEPLVAENPVKAFNWMEQCKIPQLESFVARRVSAIGTPEAVNALVKAASEAPEARMQAYLSGLAETLKGKRNVPMPKEWSAASEKFLSSPNATIRTQAMALAVVFGDKAAFSAFRTTLADRRASLASRLAALTALVDARDAESALLLQGAIADKDLRGAALKGLAAFDHPATPQAILAGYRSYSLAEKRDALATLAARPAFARALMVAVAEKVVPATDLPAEAIRQLRSFQDAVLDKQIAELWGSVRDTPAERKKLIAEWKAKLTTPPRTQPDANLGRAVFGKTCQSCHTLYAVGGKVGPEITGANRSSLDYLLENIFDPSAVIPKEYAATRLVLNDDRSVIGIIKSEANGVLTVATATETLAIPATDVASRKPSELSMMPDDIVKQLSEHELRSLIAYLQTTSQVPMLATAENAKDFFNGKDLTGWDDVKDLWKVENGEIVGKTSTGLKKNEFLKSQLAVDNFQLSLKVKLTPNKENSGVQFHSVPLPDGEMRGPQADIGAGWWGKLYEESGRGLLVKEGGEKFVKPDEWNEYMVEAIEGSVKIWINGNLCADYSDEKLARRGIFGLQMHSGGPMEVRFKDLDLKVLK